MARSRVRITGLEAGVLGAVDKGTTGIKKEQTASNQQIVDEIYEQHSGDPVDVIREALSARGITGDVDDIANQISRGERPRLLVNIKFDDS